ncbi:MAG TPA: TIGR02147 family protein [Chitinispirillaceae bacterium]|jgi:uncharacterized protein (TIGR02147 family)|nr:TIGR02147 family protein [Chitinispirillaceae bacterium]
MANIFDYTDYRKFLKDRSAYLKAANQNITYRYIAKTAGFKSAGFFSQVLNGSCNLPDRFIGSIAEIFQLRKREARYFELMVHYNQSENHDEKKRYFGKMVAFKKGRVKTIEPDAYAFYDRWYYSAIRAILNYYKFYDDYFKLSKMVIPHITAAEAKKAISVLERLGLIRRCSEGYYRLTENHITTGHDTDSVVINNFVLNTLDIAKDALYRFEKKDRNFSSLTLSISQNGYEKIRQKVEDLRAELVDLVKEDSGIDRVIQVNFQIFPLTDTKSSSER